MEHDEALRQYALRQSVRWRSPLTYTFIEILKLQGSGRLNFLENEANDEQAVAWIESVPLPSTAAAIQTHVTLVLCPGHSFRSTAPLAREVFDALMSKWKLPSVFFRIISTEMPALVRFDPNQNTALPGRNQQGLIIRNQAANFWEYTIALTYDEDVREAKAVCMGLSSKEAKRFAFAIQQSSTSAHHPLCLPMILLDISAEELCRYVESRVRDKNRNQEALGMDTYIDRGFAANLTRPRNQDLLDRDLGEMTQRLTSLSHSATGLQCNARAKIEEIEFLSAVSNGMATVSNAKSLTAISRAFDDRLEYCRQRVKAVQGEIELVLKANEAQQQTVYSLIAQRDSAHSLQAALLAQEAQKTSLLTQEQGLEMNALMKQDSKEMKIIAAVTLVFLPGTFTATLFSTSFLDWRPDSGGQYVSTNFWIYWVVTICLSILVLCGWWFVVFRQRGRISSAPSKDEKQT